jgi:hypothetical protein
MTSVYQLWASAYDQYRADHRETILSLAIALPLTGGLCCKNMRERKKTGRSSEEGSLCSNPEGLVKKLYLSENISFSDSLHLSLADPIHRLIPL